MSSPNSATKNSKDFSRFSGQLVGPILLERASRQPDDALLWAEAHRRFGNQPMRIAPAFHEIYRDKHEFMVVQKPAQIGGTELTINLAFHAAAIGVGGRGNVLYLLPNSEMAERLSQLRLAQAMVQSPALRRLAGRDASGARSTQRVQLRSIGAGAIVISGADAVTQYTGFDADLVILDEFDQMKGEVLSNAVARLRSSKSPRLVAISTPTIPEFGVHGLIERSDERHYELHCVACGRWVEPQFPANVDFERRAVVCDCRTPFDVWGEGRWVARRPEVTAVRGYQLNRLVLPDPPLSQMKLAADGTIGMKQEEFYRQDLGVPYIATDARLSAEDLDRCRAEPPTGLWLENPDAVVMGVDVAGDHFWVVIRMFKKKHSYPLFVGKVFGDWTVLDELCKRFKVTWALVDALPDMRGAKAFVNRVQGSPYAFRCYYKQAGLTHDHEWGTDARVTAVRTLSLDEMFDSFRRQRTLLPIDARDLADGAYYPHMQALVRTTEPDEFGQPIPVYVHTRPDDFAHAENYITLIADIFGRWQGWWD